MATQAQYDAAAAAMLQVCQDYIAQNVPEFARAMIPMDKVGDVVKQAAVAGVDAALSA